MTAETAAGDDHSSPARAGGPRDVHLRNDADDRGVAAKLGFDRTDAIVAGRSITRDGNGQCPVF